MNVFLKQRRGKYVVCLDYRDEDGTRKQKQIASFKTKKEANKRLTEEKAKLYNNDFIMPKNLILYDYLIEWLELRKENLSVTTYNRYKGIIINDIEKTIGKVELQQLTPLHIEKLYKTLTKRLSNKTILQYHRMLRKALEDAKKKQLLTKNVCDYIDAPKARKYTAKILTAQESQKLLEAVKNTRLELPVNLALGLGLRAGEILGLKWDKINSNKKIVIIDTNLVKDKETKKFIFKQPKSETSIRTLTVPDPILNLFKAEHKKQMDNTFVTPNPHNLVFTQISGEPMASDSFSRMFRDFLISHKLPLVRFHDLRHTHASLMLLAGTPLKVTSERLGHSNIGITGDLYTHVLQELDNEAVNNITNVLYNSK